MVRQQDAEMTVGEFNAFLVSEARHFAQNWRDNAETDAEAYPPSMTRRQWVAEFSANLPFDQ